MCDWVVANDGDDMNHQRGDDGRQLDDIRVSDVVALCGLAVSSIILWTVIVAAILRFDLPLTPLLTSAGVTFAGSLVFGWCFHAIRDRETVRLR